MNFNYRCTIDNTISRKRTVDVLFEIFNRNTREEADKLAIDFMDELLKSIIKANSSTPSTFNTNLYRESWIEGI